METGSIQTDSLSGGLDLYRTLESGQTYLWRRADDRMYGGDPASGAWYSTVFNGREPAFTEISNGRPGVVRARQRDGALEWRASDGIDGEAAVRRLLRLDDDLAAVADAAPADPLLAEAYAAHEGMRLVEDPAFGTLISFICSAQMRVDRIHGMVKTLAEEYGRTVSFDGRTYRAFPTPDELAIATEEELRALSLGYRAPYVARTAAMVADGEAHPAEARELPYEEAREYLTQFVGVGEKVADCVLLFALGFDEAVPLDTWIKTAIEEHYPDCNRGSYAATSRAIRERFGGRHAGYAQTYVFHHLRTGE